MTQYQTNPAADQVSIEDLPSIYVACLAAYNKGILHGTWIPATKGPDVILENVQAMLKDSPEPHAEEWAIHGYEGFCGIKLSEKESFEQVHAYACFVEEQSESSIDHCSYYNALNEARKALEHRYAGCYASSADFAKEMMEDHEPLPDRVIGYIDYERMGRDMELCGEILTIETAHDEVHIFWN